MSLASNPDSAGGIASSVNLIYLGLDQHGARVEALAHSLQTALLEGVHEAGVNFSRLHTVHALLDELASQQAQTTNPQPMLLISDAVFLQQVLDAHFFDGELAQVPSGANAASLTEPVISNEKISEQDLEEIARLLHDRSASVLLLAERDATQLAAQSMAVGRTLGIAVDSVLPDTPDDLLIEKLYGLVSYSLEKIGLCEQALLVEETNNHLIREQEVAKAVFDKVAGKHQVELPCVKQWLSPIAVFNGDVFMAAPTPNQDLLVLLGDFTGHGLGAALGAIPLASSFYRMASKGFSLREIIIEVNKRLNESLPTGVFCCAMIAKIDFNSGTIEYLNSGLPDCYWLKRQSGEMHALPSSGLPLGILAPAQFEVELHRFNVSQGDRLLLLSDGLLEAENRHGEAFGSARLSKAVTEQYLAAQNGADLDYLQGIKAAARTFCGSNQRFDDISLAEIEIVDFDDFCQSYEVSVAPEPQFPSAWSVDYRFAAQSLKHKDPVPQLLNLLLDEPGLKEHAGTVFSILSELYNNALDHGLLELDSAIKDGQAGFSRYYETRAAKLADLAEGEITFHIEYEACAETGTLQITVEDTGRGFEWYHPVKNAKLGFAEQDSETNGELVHHGRGIPLLHQLCDHLGYSGRGNVVKAVFSWDKFDTDSDLEQRQIA